MRRSKFCCGWWWQWRQGRVRHPQVAQHLQQLCIALRWHTSSARNARMAQTVTRGVRHCRRRRQTSYSGKAARSLRYPIRCDGGVCRWAIAPLLENSSARPKPQSTSRRAGYLQQTLRLHGPSTSRDGPFALSRVLSRSTPSPRVVVVSLDSGSTTMASSHPSTNTAPVPLRCSAFSSFPVCVLKKALGRLVA